MYLDTYTQTYPSPSNASAPLRPPPFPSPLGMSEYNKYPEGPMTRHSAMWSNSINGTNSHNSEFQIPQSNALPDATSGTSLNISKASGNTALSMITSSTSPSQGEDNRGQIPETDIENQRVKSSSHSPSFP